MCGGRAAGGRVLDVGEGDGDCRVAAAGAGRGEQPRVVSVGGAQPDRGHLAPDPLDLGGLLGAQLGRDGDVEHDEDGEGDDEGHDGGVDTEPSGEVVIRRSAGGAVGTCKICYILDTIIASCFESSMELRSGRGEGV